MIDGDRHVAVEEIRRGDTGPVAVPAGKTMRAIAVRAGYKDSAPITVR